MANTLPAYDAHNTKKGNNDPNKDERDREKKTLVCDGSCDQSTPGELHTCIDIQNLNGYGSLNG